MTQAFAIKTEKFEGPLELLLDLIEKRKIHVSDVSLAEVAESFLSYIESLDQLPVSETANFVYIASTLLLIKSRALLPGLALTEEEETSVLDLERRLTILKILREEAQTLARRYGKSIIHGREETRELRIQFCPTEQIKPEVMRAVIEEIIEAVPKEQVLETAVVRKVISLEEMVDRLRGQIEKSLHTSFRQFSQMKKTEKVEVIVSFLAMLELVKQGIIMVNQSAHFEDIHMEATAPSTPTYS